MSDIDKVKQLRQLTGAGFKDCNIAVKESNGDIDKAIEILRIKGISKASKKMSRDAKEGVVGISGDEKKTSVIEVNCETDFVAKNEDFVSFVKELSEINNSNKSDLEKLNKAKMNNGLTVEENLISHFICPYTKLTDATKLTATMVRRRPDEEPYIQVRALNGDALTAGRVDLILYNHDILAETNEQEFKEGWELIAFHAIPKGINSMPMGPITMMRNQLQLEGGTKGEYNSKEWAESVNFWQKYITLI